jgi:hypothetical protein
MDGTLTTYQAAEALDLRLDTFRQYHHRGTLGITPIGNFGQALVWRRADVERLAVARAGRGL